MSAPSAGNDSQLPRGEQLFLDHVGYFTSDLDQAGRALQHLGLQVSDVDVQASLDDTGALVAAGTSNRLVRAREPWVSGSRKAATPDA